MEGHQVNIEPTGSIEINQIVHAREFRIRLRVADFVDRDAALEYGVRKIVEHLTSIGLREHPETVWHQIVDGSLWIGVLASEAESR